MDVKIALLEDEISEDILKRFGHKMKVSIQLKYQSQSGERPKAINRVCKDIIGAQSFQHRCDASDLVMKDVLAERVEAHDREGILYQCHGGLTNLVFPIKDSLNKVDWFIFLGQFHLNKCSHCGFAECNIGFESGAVNSVKDADLENSQKPYIRSGILYSPATQRDSQCGFEPRQLIACKIIAEMSLLRFIEEVRKNPREQRILRNHIDAHPPYRDVTLTGLRDSMCTNVATIIQNKGKDKSGKCVVESVDLVDFMSRLKSETPNSITMYREKHYEYQSLALPLHLRIQDQEESISAYVRELLNVFDGERRRRAEDIIEDILEKAKLIEGTAEGSPLSEKIGEICYLLVREKNIAIDYILDNRLDSNSDLEFVGNLNDAGEKANYVRLIHAKLAPALNLARGQRS